MNFYVLYGLASFLLGLGVGFLVGEISSDWRTSQREKEAGR